VSSLLAIKLRESAAKCGEMSETRMFLERYEHAESQWREVQKRGGRMVGHHFDRQAGR
jgi:hypothetical protein